MCQPADNNAHTLKTFLEEVILEGFRKSFARNNSLRLLCCMKTVLEPV